MFHYTAKDRNRAFRGSRKYRVKRGLAVVTLKREEIIAVDGKDPLEE